jgi:phytanoyl-CoA hydroxylase
MTLLAPREKLSTLKEEKEFFDENGYLVVPDLLSQRELAELRTRVDAALAGSEPQFGDFDVQWEPTTKDRQDLPRAQRLRIMFHLCHRDPFFWSHATRPAIVDRMANLLGPDIKLYTDQLFVKGPYNGSEVPWHQDSAYWPVTPCNVISVWTALDDATVENGCVHVIPGTHRKEIEHRTFAGPQALGLLNSDVDGTREVPITLKAGSCMMHHSLLLHRSGANRSANGRRGLVTIYMPATLKKTRVWDFKHNFTLLRGREHPGCI